MGERAAELLTKSFWRVARISSVDTARARPDAQFVVFC